MSRRLSTLARVAGGLLALGSIAWIVFEFVKTGAIEQLLRSSSVNRLALAAGEAIPVYAAGLCFVALAWWCLQRSFLTERPPVRSLLATYAVTQFAKYLPGNVAHYFGRHVVLRKMGMSHRALLLGTLSEAAFMVSAALVCAANAMPTLLPWLPASLRYWQVLLAECVCLLAAYALVQWGRKANLKMVRWIPLYAPRWLLPVLPLHVVFFFAMAFALMIPAQVFMGHSADLWLLPATAAASWVAGFLVVGAPAGLGVRELVFVTLLSGHLPKEDILLLAAVFRVITFSGDVVLMLLGVLLGRQLRSKVDTKGT